MSPTALDQKTTATDSIALPDFAAITAAQARIAGAVAHTRAAYSQTLSHITGLPVALKFENEQFTASFKERGALNKLLTLTEAERKAGVVAMSAGNHAQGVAYHAARLGIPATIVMPEGTPNVKVQYTAAHGATVVLHGASLTEANSHARMLAAQQGFTFVHPFDDAAVIAGQGTIGVEFLEQIPDLDILIVPIGGGGLISGMAIAAKAIKPQIKVIGVETALYPSMKDVLEGREPRCGGATIAEGIAVKEPGELTRQIVRDLVDDIILVTEDQIEQAITLLLMVEKTVVEGAGAAGLAALLAEKDRLAPLGRKAPNVGLILCGGNIDQRLLAFVLMRDLVRGGRMARLRIALHDKPGELSRVTGLIGAGGGNIVDVSHQRIFSQFPAKDTVIEVAIETRDQRQVDQLIVQLQQQGYQVSRLPLD